MNKENLPQHVVIVPDANRRWAKMRGMVGWKGHLVGARNTKEWLKQALEIGIKCVSLWGGSWDNLTKRSKIEINVLFKIYESYCRKLIKNEEIHKNKVKVNVIGRWQEILPKSGIKAIKELINTTRDYDQRSLNFLIAYNGTDEMITAIKSIVKQARKDKGLKVTPKALEEHLWSGSLPPVDLMIRTGSKSDPHNSAGFMMWKCANTQFYFTNVMYPDFNNKEFTKAIKEYQRRERRLGK